MIISGSLEMMTFRTGSTFIQKGKTLDSKTFGQVWYAIAEEELQQSRVVSVASQLTYSHSVIVGWY
jgi:hypothetical protein